MKRIFTASLLALAVALPAGAAFAKSTKVKMSGRDCRKLVQHRARADVNFKPGVDVRGRKVVGADVNNTMKLKLPTKIEFDIGFNPLKGAAANRFGETSASVGKVKYDIGKNSFTFNGEPLNEKAMSAFAKRCQAAGR